MKKGKAIWYCTGCHHKCAVKIDDYFVMMTNCIPFCLSGHENDKPNWHKHEPDKATRELKKDLEDA